MTCAPFSQTPNFFQTPNLFQTPDFSPEEFAAKAEKSFYIPLGAASPLWLAYGGMTAGAVGFWLMTRWMKPMNLDATPWAGFSDVLEKMATSNPFAEMLIAVQPEPVAPEATVIPEVEPSLFTAVNDSPVAATVAPVVEAVEAATDQAQQAVEAATDTVIEATKAAADDLTLLVGIGPALAAKLGDLGVRSFADIASWTEDDIDTYDKRLKLMGRITREAWIDQARQLAEARVH